MGFDFAAAKAQARQAVHDTLKVAATVEVFPGNGPQDITVRWHDRINRFGNLENTGWAEVIEGIDRLIFNIPELTSKGIVLTDKSSVTLLASGLKFRLDAKQPVDGPVEEIWVVVRV